MTRHDNDKVHNKLLIHNQLKKMLDKPFKHSSMKNGPKLELYIRVILKFDCK